jgi:hypothetical protein
MGTNKELLFLDNHLDFFAELGDKLFFKKGPVDVVDKPVFRMAFGMINKAISDDVPDEFKPEFHQAMDLVVAGDYDDAGAEAVDVVIQLVNKTNLKAGVKEIILGVLGIAKGTLAALD